MPQLYVRANILTNESIMILYLCSISSRFTLAPLSGGVAPLSGGSALLLITTGLLIATLH